MMVPSNVVLAFVTAEKEMAAGKPYKTVLKELRTKARAQGLCSRDG